MKLIFFEVLTMEDFQENWSVYKKALYYDNNGDWGKAHQLVQDLSDKNAAWIHAYLHRKEGDSANASYWYNRAGKPFPSVRSAEEWEYLWEAFN